MNRLLLGVVAALMLVPAVAQAQTAPSTMYVSPSGTGSGFSPTTPTRLTQLEHVLQMLPDGGTVQMLPGTYTLAGPLTINSGNATVVAQPGAVWLGNRPSPNNGDGASGRVFLRLGTNADGLTFRGLDARNHGNGVLQLVGDVDRLTVEDFRVTNVQRFIEGDVYSATNLVLRRGSVVGFSKGVMRLRANSGPALVEDVTADGAGQDQDNFAMGFHLDGTAHDVTFRRVTVDRAQRTEDPQTSYWNGDGFAAERGVRNLLFEDTIAMRSTDGGYDVKASDVRFLRAKAIMNKRNFRVWGSRVVLEDVTSLAPTKLGGTGSVADLWISSEARDVTYNPAALPVVRRD